MIIRKFHERRLMMDCKDFDQYSSAYLDKNLTEEEKQAFEKHIGQCPFCEMKYENLKTIISSINETDEVPLPKNFNLELNKKLKAKDLSKKKKFVFKWKSIASIAAVFLLVFISSSLLNKSSRKDATSEEMYSGGETGGYNIAGNEMRTMDDMAQAVPAEDSHMQESESADNIALSQRQASIKLNIQPRRKIIQRGQITIEVENFDEVYEDVLGLVEDFNGFVQDSEIYYHFRNREKPEESLRNANMELRIPSDDFTGVFEHLKKLGVPTEENTSGENITENYMDIDNQVENLSIQEQRLREILQKADRVEDLLQVENELNRVRTQINQLTGVLKTYDGLVSMATINLNIRQVAKEVLHVKTINDNLWNKARNNFVYSINRLVKILERAVIGFFGLLPFMIPLLIMTGILGYFIYKKRKTG